MKPDEYVNRFVNLKRIPDEYRSEVELLVKLAYIDGKMHGAERFAETFRRHMLEDQNEQDQATST